MTIHTDIYEYKLMIEGIKVPFIDAVVTYSGKISQCQITMYPSKLFRKIPFGVLVHLFFKKKGIDEPFKLLFSGFNSGIAISIQGGQRRYVMIANGRMAILANLIVAASLSYAEQGIALLSIRYKKDANEKEINAATGATYIPGAYLEREGTIQSSGKEIFTSNPYDIIAALGGTTAQTMEELDETGEKAVSANPPFKIVNAAMNLSKEETRIHERSLPNPHILSSLLNDIISNAMLSASEVYNIIYHLRFRLQDILNEFPPTWTNYIASYSDSKKLKFQRALNSVINSTVGGRSTIMQLIDAILEMFHCDAWEVPGFNVGSILITPKLMQSDVPMCNVIFPSSENNVSYSQAESNKITRVVSYAYPTNERSTILNRSTGGNIRKIMAFSMFPDVLRVTKDYSDNTTQIQKMGTIIIEGEEDIGSRPRIMDYPANYMSNLHDSQEHLDFNEELFYQLRNSHKNLTIQSHFLPNIIPGLKAILMDKHMPLIFKIISVTHSISPNGGGTTAITGSEIEDLETAVFRRPAWYDVNYDPDKIHKIYEAYFGCTSMSNSTGKPGKILEAYNDIYEKYLSSEVKSYLADKLNTRSFDTEKTVFEAYGITGNQDITTAGDTDTIIYTSKVFDDYLYDGAYDINMNPKQILSRRQQPILDYVKSIYGIIGDTYE